MRNASRAHVAALSILALAACKSHESADRTPPPRVTFDAAVVAAASADAATGEWVPSNALSDVDELVVNGNTACARTHGGRVACWGATVETAAQGAAAQWLEPLTKTKQLVLGDATFGCAVDEEGMVRCWGDGRSGQLGIGTPPEVCSSRPLAPTFNEVLRAPCARAPRSQRTDLQVTALSAGWLHACSVTTLGNVYCWGGSFGVGKTDDQCPQSSELVSPCNKVPRKVDGVSDAVEVASGQGATCARTKTGDVWCWGNGDSGVLGAAHPTGTSDRPVKIIGLSGAEQLVTNGSSFCARAGGEVSCWGERERGKLGDGAPYVPMSGPNDHGRPKPSRVLTPSGPLTAVKELWASSEVTCASRDDGVYCWGHLPRTIVLPGVSVDPCPTSTTEQYCKSTVAIRVTDASVHRLSMSSSGACALDTARHVRCTKGPLHGGGELVVTTP